MPDTRQQLLDAADVLLAERSYNGFSYADLSAQLGLRKPSIHYHFPRKQDLIEAIVESYARGFTSWMSSLASKSAPQQLEAYFELFAGFVARGHGCPTAVLSAEYGTLPEEVARALRRLMVVHVDWLTGVLERGRARGEFRFDGAAAELARTVAATVQGAVLCARALGPQVYAQISRSVRSLVSSAS